MNDIKINQNDQLIVGKRSCGLGDYVTISTNNGNILSGRILKILHYAGTIKMAIFEDYRYENITVNVDNIDGVISNNTEAGKPI